MKFNNLSPKCVNHRYAGLDALGLSSSDMVELYKV